MPTDDDDFATYMATQWADDVVRTTAERKANPLPFAIEALRDLFGGEFDKEAGSERFRYKLEHFHLVGRRRRPVPRAGAGGPARAPRRPHPPRGQCTPCARRADWTGDRRRGEPRGVVARDGPRLRAMFEDFLAECRAKHGGTPE